MSQQATRISTGVQGSAIPHGNGTHFDFQPDEWRDNPHQNGRVQIVLESDLEFVPPAAVENTAPAEVLSYAKDARDTLARLRFAAPVEVVYDAGRECWVVGIGGRIAPPRAPKDQYDFVINAAFKQWQSAQSSLQARVIELYQGKNYYEFGCWHSDEPVPLGGTDTSALRFALEFVRVSLEMETAMSTPVAEVQEA